MQRSRPLHLLYPRPALRCLVTRRALCITSPAILRPTTLDVEPGRAPPELHRRFASRGPMCGRLGDTGRSPSGFVGLGCCACGVYARRRRPRLVSRSRPRL